MQIMNKVLNLTPTAATATTRQLPRIEKKKCNCIQSFLHCNETKSNYITLAFSSKEKQKQNFLFSLYLFNRLYSFKTEFINRIIVNVCI